MIYLNIKASTSHTRELAAQKAPYDDQKTKIFEGYRITFGQRLQGKEVLDTMKSYDLPPRDCRETKRARERE